MRDGAPPSKPRHAMGHDPLLPPHFEEAKAASGKENRKHSKRRGRAPVRKDNYQGLLKRQKSAILNP
jgi:hypothetical protein